MKILMLTHRFPWPPNQGTTIRSYHLLKFLASRHEVQLLSFVESANELVGRMRPLQDLCEKVEAVLLHNLTAKLKGATALLNGTPLSVKAFYSKTFESHFVRMVQTFKPDIVFTDSSVLAFYPLKYQLPFIADFMDVDSEKWNQFSKFAHWPLSWIYQTESKRLALFEKKIAECSKTVLVVSENEKSRLESLAPAAPVCTIPSGVDGIGSRIAEGFIQGRIVFTGDMNYFPNVDGVLWFCREILPQIQKKVPYATFYIVGSNPNRKIRALGNLPGVYVTGTVLDVKLYINEAEVCVAPLRFAIGLQNKVLEALAMGKAMVVTPGAIQGFREEAKDIVKTAETADSFANRVVEFLMNAAQRSKYEKAGPQFVLKYHDWSQNLEIIEKYLTTLNTGISRNLEL